MLCEGNHCRSPIAEGLFRAGLGPGFRVESAGLAALEGYAPHPQAIRLMAEQGQNITGLRGHQVTEAQALAADLILVMDHQQKAWCERFAPSIKGRVFLLGHWLQPGGQEIPDPIDDPACLFEPAFALILQAVTAWSTHLLATSRST